MEKMVKGQLVEIPDNTPVELPLGYEHPESLENMIKRMVRIHSQIASESGAETLEEADDFDEEDNMIVSDHQFTDMQEEMLNVPIKERYAKRSTGVTDSAGSTGDRLQDKTKKDSRPDNKDLVEDKITQ